MTCLGAALLVAALIAVLFGAQELIFQLRRPFRLHVFQNGRELPFVWSVSIGLTVPRTLQVIAELGRGSRIGTGEGNQPREPKDITNIALFLASEESRMINGAVIPAGGGISAY
jgi:hypothetical protein